MEQARLIIFPVHLIVCLHGAVDWKEGRKNRMIKEEATNCQDTEQNVVEFPKTNEAEEELEDEQK